LFHTPGVFYRPESLKTMNVLLGNTESRILYKNFNLENLNSNNLDWSHFLYQKYLQYKKFIPANDTNYFSHMVLNTLPNQPLMSADKGLFNIFPLDLDPVSDELKIPSTSLGIISTSPLKLELEFSPVPSDDLTWFISFTFVYLNKINFTGNKLKQDVVYDYVMT
jgi:hypothetical protein